MLGLSRLKISLMTSAGVGGSFSPASLFASGEPGGWYDPSDLTTLFQDSAGTTPVTAAGQSVGRILDKSGRGNHATQPTAASRPVYQVDSNGKPFLQFDGSDDSLVTPTITPGTDKAQVFAGVRKLSDAGAVVAEFSNNINGVNGSLALLTSGYGALGARWGWVSRGTSLRNADTATDYVAPITNVLSGIGDISGDLATLRVNGTQAAQNTADQGTGNYLAYPLYIGRRGGTTLPFNGRIYQMIVRFGANLSAATITQTENWVAGKTGITI